MQRTVQANGTMHFKKCKQREKNQLPDMLYLVKTHKIANNSATTEAEKKISTDLEYVESSCCDISLSILDSLFNKQQRVS
jgi:hypothetical protein